MHFHAAAAKSYETSGAIGKPEWDSLFGFILARMSHLRFLSTVYVLVDNRDLTNLDNPDPSLQHWPAVAAWWSSRACMMGPAQERCDVVYFPIGQASGLHNVHPTWAGTVWSSRGSTLCCLIVTVYQSRSLRSKIYGRKLSDCNAVAFLVKGKPAVVLGI